MKDQIAQIAEAAAALFIIEEKSYLKPPRVIVSIGFEASPDRSVWHAAVQAEFAHRVYSVSGIIVRPDLETVLADTLESVKKAPPISGKDASTY